MTTTGTDSEETTSDKRREAAFGAAVDRLSKELQSEHEHAQTLKKTNPGRRRSSVLLPIVAIGALITGGELWYLSRPISPQAPPSSRSELTAEQADAASSVADMIVVEHVVRSYQREHGRAPSSGVRQPVRTRS